MKQLLDLIILYKYMPRILKNINKNNKFTNGDIVNNDSSLNVERLTSKELEEVWSEVTEKIIIKGIENAFKPNTRYGKDYLKG